MGRVFTLVGFGFMLMSTAAMCQVRPEPKPPAPPNVGTTSSATETPPPAPQSFGTTSSVTGKITGYTTAPRGEMDGFTLDSGTTVHFPPHAGAQLKPLLQKGQSVTVTGTNQAGPSGQVLEASTVKNLSSGQSVSVAAISAPNPPADAAPPLPRGAVSPPGQPPLK